MNISEVSPIHRCKTVNARRLCLYDVGVKLKAPGQYDIGGTYMNDQPELWFFCYTSLCPGFKYLLNLFVCYRKAGILSIGVSTGNELIHQNNVGGISYSQLPDKITWKILRAVQPNENCFIRTFCFSEVEVTNMKNNTLYIPVMLNWEPNRLLMDETVNRVKLQHDFGDLLFNKDKTDFLIKTPSGKQQCIHKIVLAAHSPVLRTMIKNQKDDSMFIDISDNDLDLLLQFLYTGTIKDLLKQNCLQLLEIAERFQLKNLFLLTQYAISKQVTIDNAIDIALLSEKYKLAEMQSNIFAFIKKNPEVLQTEGWKKLNDVSLTKKLLEHIYRDNNIILDDNI